MGTLTPTNSRLAQIHKPKPISTMLLGFSIKVLPTLSAGAVEQVELVGFAELRITHLIIAALSPSQLPSESLIVWVRMLEKTRGFTSVAPRAEQALLKTSVCLSYVSSASVLDV